MVEAIKDRLNELLKKKHVSLVMLYDKDGNILWHKGREIKGRSIESGMGFCRSIIQESFQSSQEIFENNVYLKCSPESDSAKRLLIKSIIIYPIDSDFFLYVDSGTRMAFTDMEHWMMRMLVTVLKDSIQQIRKSETDIGGISGSSPAIERVKELVLKYSIEDDCVLLTGETGVGKTHIAELIHRYSGRKGKFVVAETTVINENLFESEIFGHKKGSFTSAFESKGGLIQEAEKGTLFFDEISETPLSFQAKFLRFIDKKRFRVVGDALEKEADVRILAASNKDLRKMIDEGKFREDLYYRLNVFNITIPPLRERKEDIRSMVHSGKKYLKGKTVDESFWKEIMEYSWPGNIRELFSVLKRAGILCESPINGTMIQNIIQENFQKYGELQHAAPDRTLWKQFQEGADFWEVIAEPFLKRELNRSQVKQVIQKALALAQGKYIHTMQAFNLPLSHYKRYMRFLHQYKLQ